MSATAAAPAVELRNATKKYGEFVALSGVDLTVAEGTVHAVIGTNGAGKSTLLGVLAGTVSPTAGRVRLRGRDVTRAPGWRRARLGLGRSFQVSRLFESMTVKQNVEIAAAVATRRTLFVPRRSEERRRVGESLVRAGLDEVVGERAANLSQGDQKRLEIALALASGATILALDEPTSGMSATETAAVTRLLKHVAEEQGMTILLIEHDMDVVFALSDRITVLDHGQIAFEGTPDETARNERVREIYLGTHVPVADGAA
jgi:ABC-type branched-subunit amino acid transport system ATPase component